MVETMTIIIRTRRKPEGPLLPKPARGDSSPLPKILPEGTQIRCCRWGLDRMACAFIVVWCVLQLSGAEAQPRAVLVAGQNPAQAAAWQPGEVCTNSSYDPAKKNFLAALRGKKLRFGVAEPYNNYAPYIIKDATLSGNAMYSG